MQLFIALTFYENDLFYKKIDSFRSRFDTKYNRSPILLMSLMSPFSFVKEGSRAMSYHHLVECLRDDLDTYLTGACQELEIRFSGFDFKIGKKGVVYLRPGLPNELYFFKETTHDFLKDHGAKFSREQKNLLNKEEHDFTFLPIGRSGDQELLSHAVRKAQSEFSAPFSLWAKDVTLFEKLPGQWISRSVLHEFSYPHDYEEEVLNAGFIHKNHFTI